jgi:hypothetical protein
VVFKVHPGITEVKINDHIHIEKCDFRGRYSRENPRVKFDQGMLGDDVRLPGDRE